ncbi:MAG: hypothetical protein ACJAUR_002090 [Ulvibacter sp.]|jgi:hypothetical protein
MDVIYWEMRQKKSLELLMSELLIKEIFLTFKL